MPLAATHFWRKIIEKVKKKVKKIGIWKPPYYEKFKDEWLIIGTTLHHFKKRSILKGIVIFPIRVWNILKGTSYRGFENSIDIEGKYTQPFSTDLSLKGIFYRKIRVDLFAKCTKTFRRLYEILFEDE